MEEEWSVIPEFPRYSVSSLGRVRRDRTGRIMVLTTNAFNVVSVGLIDDDSIQRRRSVPLLVAQAFVPRPNDVFDTPICLDGDRENVSAANLAWRPRWFAIKYHQQFDDPWHSPLPRPIRDVKTGQRYENSLECAKACGLLEKDLVLSIMNQTFVWPTYQQFEIVWE